MHVYLNNCKGRPHAKLYPQPFYDLETTGPQATQATDLPKGTQCVVATGLDGDRVRFGWFTFSHEGIHADDTGEMCRVFYGMKTDTVTLGKREAAADPRFSMFFNVLGHFKQLSVIPS